jgi:hypothetical protein
MKNSTFWDVTPCSLLEFYRLLGLLFTFFWLIFLGLLFNSEDAGSTFSETYLNFFQITQHQIPKDDKKNSVATAACWRSIANFLGIESVAWSAQRIPPVVSLGFLDRSRYYFFQVAPQLYSRG